MRRIASERRERRVGGAQAPVASSGRAPIGLWWSAAVLVAGAAVAAWVLWRHRFFLHDDCFIALRYAHNLLLGRGLVWNPGERVEGYSSLAAVLGVAGLGALGMPLPLAARALDALGLLAAAAAVFGFARRCGLPPLQCASLAALVLGFVPLGAWVMGGLEAPLFAGALTLALAAMATRLEADAPHPRRDALAGLALGALVLVRPDGAWFGAVASVAYLAHFRADPRRLRGFLCFAGAGLALPAAHLLFRLVYYGAWLPNSVIAKTLGIPHDAALLESGLRYAGSFVARAPVVLALVLLLAGFSGRGARAPLACLLAAAAGYAVLVVLAGGDHMVESRLLAPLLPVLLLGSARGLAAQGWTSAGRQALLVAVALGALALQPLARVGHKPDSAAYLGETVGRYLARSQPPGTLVAANSAGATAYFAPDLRFVDMLGLNDAHIARRRIERFELDWQSVPGHAKGDGAYVLRRRPAIVILGPVDGRSLDEPWFLSDLEMAADPAFARDYVLDSVRLDVRDRRFHRAYARTRDGVLTLRYYRRRSQHGGGSAADREPPQNWK